MGDFAEKSHEKHRGHYEEHTEDGGRSQGRAQTWLRKDTVDSWRHKRLLDTLLPILSGDPGRRWLTVGDGRYGREAQYLADRGADTLPSDISTKLLAEAERRDLINDYAEENAEDLSFEDGAFDWVLCKESYHHFPRPYIALYEMLRVADRGVVLIEPNDAELHDNLSTEPVLRLLLNGISRLRGDDSREPAPPIFEPSGNYVFSISRREVKKVALGLDYAAVAFKGINDHYVDGCEDEPLSERGPVYRKIKTVITARDLLCRFRLVGHSKLVAAVFKCPPSDALVTALSRAGYDVTRLPNNPHIDP